MKPISKIFHSILICAIVCAVSSCQGAPGRDGMDGRDGFGVIKNVDIDVPMSSWNYTEDFNNNYFYARIRMPEINRNVFKGGLVEMYRVFNYGYSDVSQMKMPFTRVVEEYVEDEDRWAFYSENIDYDFSEGWVTIYYRMSDFYYEIDETFVPEAMNFRCVIVY